MLCLCLNEMHFCNLPKNTFFESIELTSATPLCIQYAHAQTLCSVYLFGCVGLRALFKVQKEIHRWR